MTMYCLRSLAALATLLLGASALSLRPLQTVSKRALVLGAAAASCSDPVSSRSAATASAASRVGWVASAALLGLGPARAARAGFFTSAEQDAVTEIATYQKPVFELLESLRPVDLPNAIGVYAQTQVLKGGKEDSDVVTTYVYTYIAPMQAKMEAVARQLKLPAEADQSRIEVLPALMKGHMIELKQAIAEMKAENQAREVEEVQETLAEFLKLASTKYLVANFVPTRPLSDSELFGPLGCEFWGKKRVPGSNACQDPTPST